MANEPISGPAPESKTSEQEAAELLAELSGESTAEAEAAAEEETQNLAQRILGPIWTLLGFLFSWFIVPAGIVLTLHYFIFQAYHVVGSSMFPSLNEDDYLVISKVGPSVALAQEKFTGKEQDFIPKRGDVLIFRYPLNPNLTFVKRVVAVPGERVVVKDGSITVYNEEYPDGFDPDKNLGYQVSDPVTLGSFDDTVPEGQIFVVGDNRSPGGSFDSREWGFLPSEDIIGVAVLRLLPVNNFEVF